MHYKVISYFELGHTSHLQRPLTFTPIPQAFETPKHTPPQTPPETPRKVCPETPLRTRVTPPNDTARSRDIRSNGLYMWNKQAIPLFSITSTPEYRRLNPKSANYHEVYVGTHPYGEKFVVKILNEKNSRMTATYQESMFRTGCKIQQWLAEHLFPVIPLLCSSDEIIENRVWVLPYCDTWTPTAEEKRVAGHHFFTLLFNKWKESREIVFPDLKPDNIMRYGNTLVVVDFFEEAPDDWSIGAEIYNRMKQWGFTPTEHQALTQHLRKTLASLPDSRKKQCILETNGLC